MLQLFPVGDKGRLQEDEEYNVVIDGGGGRYSNENIEWGLCTYCQTKRLISLVVLLMTFRYGRLTERIESVRKTSLRDRPLSAIRGQWACTTRPEVEAYSVGGGDRGGGGGEKVIWCKRCGSVMKRG